MPKEIKLQCTLTDSDYYGWVCQQLQERRGMKPSTLAHRAWEEWVERHEAKLGEWGLSAEAWERSAGGNITNIETQRRRRTKTAQKSTPPTNETANGGGP